MATAEVDEGTVYLDLTHDEADALVVVLGRVGGYPDGRRKHTSDIYYALAGAGVPLAIDQERGRPVRLHVLQQSGKQRRRLMATATKTEIEIEPAKPAVIEEQVTLVLTQAEASALYHIIGNSQATLNDRLGISGIFGALYKLQTWRWSPGNVAARIREGEGF